jgi:hypothetical protein
MGISKDFIFSIFYLFFFETEKAIHGREGVGGENVWAPLSSGHW